MADNSCIRSNPRVKKCRKISKNLNPFIVR